MLLHMYIWALVQQGMPTYTVKVFEDAGAVEAPIHEHSMLMVRTTIPAETLCDYAAGGWAESASSTKGGGHSPQPLHCWRVHCHHDGHRASAQGKGWSLRRVTDTRQVHSSVQADSCS